MLRGAGEIKPSDGPQNLCFQHPAISITRICDPITPAEFFNSMGGCRLDSIPDV
jgi:hypothetical protein